MAPGALVDYRGLYLEICLAAADAVVAVLVAAEALVVAEVEASAASEAAEVAAAEQVAAGNKIFIEIKKSRVKMSRDFMCAIALFLKALSRKMCL